MGENREKWIGHLAIFGVYLIFAINVIICKDITNSRLISPMGLFFLRSLGAALLFWLISLFTPREKVPLHDLFSIFGASMLGLFATQYTFLNAISLATPIDVALLACFTPIFTMFIAAIVLKEPITLKKAGGVAISFMGVTLLILNTTQAPTTLAHSHPSGIILMILNALFFALYLGIFRPLINRYHTITFMKWMFLFSTLAAFPLSFKELSSINYMLVPTNYWLELGFLIFFATFVAYFLLPIGQKRLRPTVLSLYTYEQPLIAAIISIYLGMDVISIQKIIAVVAIISGMILVNKSRAAANNLTPTQK